MKFEKLNHMKLSLNTNLWMMFMCFCTTRTPSVEGISLFNTKFHNPELRDVAKNNKVLLDLRHSLREKEWDPLSPEGSWLLFNENDAIQNKKNRKRNCKRCSKNIPMPKEGPPGPQGPRGPQGPQGESGGTLSLQEIEDYIKVYVADLLLSNKTMNYDVFPIKKRSPFKEPIPVVFTGQLSHKEVVSSQKASIIRGFTVTFGPGQFKRGVIVKDGRFTVTRAGVYQVVGTVPVQRVAPHTEPKMSEEKSPAVFVCVDSCLSDRRLKWSATFQSRTSAVFGGHIRLSKGQTLMVLLSNPTSSNIEVLPGSTFSAALIGT